MILTKSRAMTLGSSAELTASDVAWLQSTSCHHLELGVFAHSARPFWKRLACMVDLINYFYGTRLPRPILDMFPLSNIIVEDPYGVQKLSGYFRLGLCIELPVRIHLVCISALRCCMTALEAAAEVYVAVTGLYHTIQFSHQLEDGREPPLIGTHVPKL